MVTSWSSRPGQLAGLAVAEDRVGAVPVLHHLEALVDLPPERDQAQVVGHEDGPHGPADLDQGGVGGVLGPGPGEAAQDGLGLGRAQPKRGGVLHHLVVLLGDQVPADRPGDDRAQMGIRVRRAVGSVQALRPDVLEPGQEGETEQVGEGEPDGRLAVGCLLSQLTGLQGSRANAARTSITPKSATRLRHIIRPFTRLDTRYLGYVDTNYWGFRFPDRRSAFDLTAISQRWLRDITWDHLADVLDGPARPRTAGPIEQVRRSLVCLSAYLRECDPFGGGRPDALTGSTGKGFVADITSRVTGRQPVRGVVNRDGSTSPATPTSYALTMNAVRRVLRWALESGAAGTAGLPREFVVAIPFGRSPSSKNPRPFSDPVLATLSDPANIALLDGWDPHDGGLADIWSIQVRCGRRIGEVVKLRLDCVSEHLGRTWMWVDMTKVGKLDYAIQIPRDVYDLIRTRQGKTLRRFRGKFGVDPTPQQRRALALFPSRVSNPTLERSISPSLFAVAFKAWLCSDGIGLSGHTSHQARHTLATRLVEAGASMAHVKKVLGHVSERMGEFYVLIAGSQVEPFLQQV